ncbi:AraC family transcriptional regulator ligand-binding domain-containing protein [Gynuella sp.]|uniref:helix-turn-helix transcriptional regulator n=1 Tax=Gynuella sp. TaxID=2969146 RepID=UPI003D1020C7
MNSLAIDKGRFPPTLWRALEKTGLEPPAILRTAGLPVTAHLDTRITFTTEQIFAIWKAVEFLTDDPTLTLSLIASASQTGYQPAFIAALYASDFRDAIHRIERFKRMGACEKFLTVEQDNEYTIIKEWPHAREPEPATSIDLSFAFLMELGRQGTRQHLIPIRIEYNRVADPNEALKDYFGCPIMFAASRNAITFKRSDLAIPFPGYSPEFLALITPNLASAFAEIEAESSTSERVKVILKRALASGRPEIGMIAKELGMSERTLQRRITDEATTFRTLLTDARRELGQQMLTDPDIDISEVAYMLGYQDTTSFYRAFKDWEGISPGEWRALNVVEPVQHH